MLRRCECVVLWKTCALWFGMCLEESRGLLKVCYSKSSGLMRHKSMRGGTQPTNDMCGVKHLEE